MFFCYAYSLVQVLTAINVNYVNLFNLLCLCMLFIVVPFGVRTKLHSELHTGPFK